MLRRVVSSWRSLSLRWQMTVVVASLIALTLASLGLFLDLSLAAYLEDSSSARLHQLADPVITRETREALRPLFPRGSSRSGPPADSVILSRLAFDLANAIDGPETFALVTTPDGTLAPLDPASPGRAALQVPQLPLDPTTFARVVQRRQVESHVTSDGGTRYLVLFVPLVVGGRVIGVAVLGDSLARADALLRTFQLSLLGGTLVAALVAGLAARALIAAGLRPLGRVGAAPRRVAAGDWETRVGRDVSSRELGQLAQSFDQMVEQLQKVFEAQRRFVADASHELRTPLTAVSGMLEMIELNADGGDPAARRRIQAALTREVERLGRLVDDLLTLSRVEREEPTPELVQLDSVVAELRPTLEALANGHDLYLQVDPVPPVLGQRMHLEQVVVNLVENAAKYTPAGGRIGVEVHSRAGQVILRIQDTGVGIHPEALPRIFERFYRADTSRARASGGSGLGLAIVQAIVAAHHGTVDVISQVGQGTAFTIGLPAVVVDAA